MEHDREIMHLRDYLLVLRKRRWLIASIFIVVVLLAGLFTVTMQPVYEGETILSIEPDEANVVSIEEVFTVDASNTEYYQTQYNIISSRSIARRVIKELNLDESEEFFPKPGSSLVAQTARWLKETIGELKGAIMAMFKPPSSGGEGLSPEEARMQQAVAIFATRLSVEPVRNSRLVQITFEAHDPALAKKITDTIAQEYINHSMEMRLSTIQDAIAWLNKRIAKERVKVENAESRFQAFKDEHSIISDFSANIEQVKANQLADLRAKIVDAETEMIEARTRYQQTKSLMDQGQPLDSIPAVLENQLILTIKQKEVELRNRLSELSRTYGPNHPQIRSVNAELATLESRMRTEATKIMESLQNRYQLVKSRYDSLVASLKEQEEQALGLNKLAAEYNTLKSDAEGAREIFNMLVQRFKEASVSEDMPTVNIHVVDAAQVPTDPVRPKTFIYLAVAAIFGLGLGLGVAFLLEYLDNTLKTPSDVKRWLSAPFLGVIPFQRGVTSNSPGMLASVIDPKSLASEAYRSLRTNVLFSLADQEPRVFQVTSAGPGEGKTLTAINLAVTMAQNGSKTVIVDCDLRRPMVHKTLGVHRQRGVSNILANPKEDIESMILETDVPNLYVVPAGPIPPNPSELLGGKRMQELLDHLNPMFDKIIVDTPPVTAVTDASLIASKVEGVVMVVRAFATSREVVRTGLDILRKLNAKILGVVLNGVKLEKEGYYYYQYYYYYYASDGEGGRKRRRRKTPEGAASA